MSTSESTLRFWLLGPLRVLQSFLTLGLIVRLRSGVILHSERPGGRGRSLKGTHPQHQGRDHVPAPQRMNHLRSEWPHDLSSHHHEQKSRVEFLTAPSLDHLHSPRSVLIKTSPARIVIFSSLTFVIVSSAAARPHWQNNSTQRGNIRTIILLYWTQIFWYVIGLNM